VLRFHFDYLSPYAWLAWTQVHASPPATAGPSSPSHPVRALLAHGGTKGPAEIPAKRIYVFKTRSGPRAPSACRSSHRVAPVQPADRAPRLGLVGGDEQRRLIDALFRETWAAGTVWRPTTRSPARRTPSARREALVARSAEPEGKQRLRTATEGAIAAGVFGVPTMIADGELFWGYDSFGHLERFLAGEDPLRPEDLTCWAGLPSSATR